MDSLVVEDHGVSVELEALQAIYIHELEVSYCPDTNVPKLVSINLHPSTADNANEQYVRLTLAISISPNYPHEIPEISIRSPRGLSDNDLERIYSDTRERARQSKGSPMLFELIEIAKEHLTLGNTPSCVCTICLYGFSKEDVFTKTECYHYFHSHCLYRFINASLSEETVVQPLFKETAPENKILCPVCREPFTYDLTVLKAPPPIQSEKAPSFKMDKNLTELQHQMSELFAHQKFRGGIIDLEEEKNKFLIEISSVQSNVEPGLHVNRAGFDNNVTGAKKKNNRVKKNVRDYLPTNNGGRSLDSSIPPRVSKSNTYEEPRDKLQSSQEVVEAANNSNHKESNLAGQSSEGGNRGNLNRGGRNRNYRRTNNQEKYNSDNSRIRMSQSGSKPFPLRQDVRHGATSSSNSKHDVKKMPNNENGYSHRNVDIGDVGGRRNYYNVGRPRSGGNRTPAFRNAQDKTQSASFSSKSELNGLTDSQVNSEKCIDVGGDSSSPKWVQPLVVTGPPKMAFGGAVPATNQSKNGVNRPPPGFETKGRTGAGLVVTLPPARFHSIRPPPGFNNGSDAKDSSSSQAFSTA